jgi:hypothetical protein
LTGVGTGCGATGGTGTWSPPTGAAPEAGSVAPPAVWPKRAEAGGCGCGTGSADCRVGCWPGFGSSS